MAAAAQAGNRRRRESAQWQTTQEMYDQGPARGASNYSSEEAVGMLMRKHDASPPATSRGGPADQKARMAAMGMSLKNILSQNQLQAARDNNNFSLLQGLPAPQLRIREGSLNKRMPGGGKWGERHCILTFGSFIITKAGSDVALEDIPLHDIAGIVRVADASPQMTKALDSKVVPTTRSRQAHRGLAELDTLALAFELETRETLHQNRRTYMFRCNNLVECNQWVIDIRRAVDEATRRWKNNHKESLFKRSQQGVKAVYQSQFIQAIVAFLILASFVVNLATAEWRPEAGSPSEKIFELLDTIFTSVFTAELLFNFYGNAFYPFFNDGWNLFDLFVIAISWISFFSSGSSQLNQLRILRVFRVIRLFRRLRRLKQIVNALTASLVPVASSFVVLALVTSIYAVVAVNILADKDPLRFGYFSTAFFTMTQLCVGWAEEELRPLWEVEDGSLDTITGVFFMSYILFAGVVLINIVVAVLLDEFITSVAAEKAEFEKERIAREGTSEATRLIGPLDPVLETLAQYGTAEDLAARIESLYGSLDIDDSGKLSFQELSMGFSRLKFKPRIMLTWDDFEIMTDGLELCDENGELGINQFEELMRRQMQSYSQRTMANAMEEGHEHEDTMRSIMLALKQLGISLEMMSKEQQMIRRMLTTHHPRRSSIVSDHPIPLTGVVQEPAKTTRPGSGGKRPLSARKKKLSTRNLKAGQPRGGLSKEDELVMAAIEENSAAGIPRVLEGEGDIVKLVQSYLDNSDDLSGAGTPPPLPGSLGGTPRDY